MNKFNIIAIVCIFSLLLLSCSKETGTITESSFNATYFPVQVGKTWIYKSDSILYFNGGNGRDTFTSYIKETISSTFVNEVGQEVFKIDRFFKRNETDDWSQLNTWTTSVNAVNAIRTEENFTFIKLIFPFKKGSRWNGNAFINVLAQVEVRGESVQPYKNWKYRIDNVDQTYNFEGQNYPIAVVQLVNDSTLVDKRKVIETYAKGIGLVKKEMQILDRNGGRPNDPWFLKAEKGFIHTLTLVDVE